jgi:hypothetical protein
MNGWPATAASTFLSFRTCSTCFNLMTVHSLLSSCCSSRLSICCTYRRPSSELSTRIPCYGLRASGLPDVPARHARRYLRNESPINYDVPSGRPDSVLRSRLQHTCAQRLHKLKIIDPEFLRGQSKLFVLWILRDLFRRQGLMSSRNFIVRDDKVFLFLPYGRTAGPLPCGVRIRRTSRCGGSQQLARILRGRSSLLLRRRSEGRGRHRRG